MASHLPVIPRVIFTVVEPISLLVGAIPAILWPEWFVSEQLPSAVPLVTSANASLVAQQLGSMFSLGFLLAIAVLYTTTEIKVVRSYLFALWLADISHVGLTLYALGWEGSLDVASWNPMTWGNVAFTVFLCLTRSVYLVGGFGPDVPSLTAKKSQ
ncbi:hypothetical protein GQ53DRAFT_444505 [Thozetella sp. PMI_491]|nr:hypothetical protein GQ53DRAFT_444505 [Thozetella sp. PMI_491]